MWTNGSHASSGRVRWVCRHNGEFCYTSTFAGGKDAIARNGKKLKTAVFKRVSSGKSRFIVTAAQNATPVHERFLQALERAAEHLDAEIIVIPIRYKNPTSRWTASQANAEEWDEAVRPYLCNTRIRLCRNLVVLGDVKTQPTASSPLTGFEAITHGESGILGHTKLQLRTVPTPQHVLPKILTTTGAVTVANYTDSKAGKLGEFHHTLGAVLVELEGGRFHLRQLNADKDGSFYDLTTFYSSVGIAVDQPVAAVVMGDTHVDFIARHVKAATFGKGGIVETLEPQYLVWNDVLDAYSVNPHHGGNPFIGVAKLQAGRSDVRAEVERAAEFIAENTPKGCESIVVPSNHNDFLARWILNSDWRTNPGAARFYLETALAMVDSARLTESGAEYADPTSYWLRRLLHGANVKVLNRGDSFTVHGVEVGLHGDIGPHGSKGSLRNLRRIGARTVIGHSHAPGIDEGAVQVGTSTELVLEYNRGSPSGWMNTHCVIYPNGKRALINIIDGRWRQ
jgi:hypothetical protein